jgi:rhodanese-related sulfurtransferase
MSCLGNTIARSLALVTVGTAAAFTHWAIRPLSSLASPVGLTDEPAPDQPAIDAGQDNPGDTTADPADNTTDQEQQTAPPPAQAFDPARLDTKITGEETYQLWLLGTTTFIDARKPEEYEAGHIPYAFLVPAEGNRAQRLGNLIAQTGIGPSQRVVIYCEGGTCSASELVALDLQDMGFTKIHIDTGGFPAWQAAGYEIESGPDMLLGDPE